MNPGMDLRADSQSAFPRISPKGLRLEMGPLVKEKESNNNMLTVLKLPSRGRTNSYPQLPYLQVLGECKSFPTCCV